MNKDFWADSDATDWKLDEEIVAFGQWGGDSEWYRIKLDRGRTKYKRFFYKDGIQLRWWHRFVQWSFVNWIHRKRRYGKEF